MADFCPLSSASSNSAASNTVSCKTTSKPVKATKKSGQLWKKIGIVGSVAVIGSQPVLAQIELSTNEAATLEATTEVAPFNTVTPEMPTASVPVVPPVVISPEAAPPSFSNATGPVVSSSVEATASQVENEIVTPDAEPAVKPESTTTEPEVASAGVEKEVPETEATIIDSATESTTTEPEVASATQEEVPETETPTEETTAQEEAPETETPTEEIPTETDATTTETKEGLPEMEDAISETKDAISETEDAISEAENTIPEVEIVTPSDVVPDAIPTVEESAAKYGDVFIESTEPSEAETLDPDAPEVFVSERSTGCEYTVDADDMNDCGVSSEDSTAVADVPEVTGPETSIKLGPVSINRSGVHFSGGATTVAGREFYNTVAKPLVDLQVGESFIFPLASPSPITSLFGWRWHPIHHDYRFHSGTDVGAPQGTPILATQAGQVSVADYLGGYGLTVILRHNDNTLESRYAHMSHILVQPGEWVEQGEVIGLVGSTGNSTGPHLHFELRQLTSQGWSAINPDNVLRYALANLNNRMSGNPLQAFNIIPPAQASGAQAALPKGIKTETLVKDAPHFRPAQPHAQ